MKNLMLLFFFFALTASSFGQRLSYDRYTVSGGFLGALNFSRLVVDKDAPGNIDYDFEKGWSAGVWLNLPLSESFSVEPQVMYSLYKYHTTDFNTLIPYGTVSAITIPILFKADGRSFALALGPQFDLLGKIDDTPTNVLEDDFSSTSIGITAGLEILPHGPIVPYVRYTHGITDFDNRDVDDNVTYYNSVWQLGLKVKLFGKMIPADTDGDGIIDKEDLCPVVAGLAALNGCPDADADGITDASDDCPNVAGIERYKGCPIPDTDNDGVNDEVDKCPKQAGIAKYNGCPIPDTDSDGINDEEDKCPAQAGIAKYDGCPIPDTDGDGVNDENDKCPTVKGLSQFSGCPNPDKDNDGVVDAEDWCPDIKGPANNHGCPKVENAVFNPKMIQFVTGSANLTAQAKKDLKEGAKLLNSGDFANLKVEIQGHTDNVGSSTSNHTLSHKRADSVKAELIKNGVRADRLTTIGYGEDQPIADNGTAAGRTLNRRVELVARQ